MATKRTVPQCDVCGSSAPITRIIRWPKSRTLYLCYGHEAACSEHLADPCPICDTDYRASEADHE